LGSIKPQRHLGRAYIGFSIDGWPFTVCDFGRKEKLNHKMDGRHLLYSPNSSTSLAGIIWGWIYNPLFGLLNFVLDGVGLGNLAGAWLAESNTALLSLNVVGAWTFFGFCVVIYLAAIQSIDPSLYEAAEIDGAKWWRKFRDITVPLLKNSTLFLGLYAAIEAMRFFDLIWVTTQGGPGYATEVLTTHVYKTFFLVGDFGYASVLSVVLLAIVLTLSSISFWVLRSK